MELNFDIIGKNPRSLLMMLDKLLNLKGTSIQGYLHLDNIGIVFKIESKNKKAECSRCGLESDKINRNHRPLVKDLSLSNPQRGQAAFLFFVSILKTIPIFSRCR